MSEPRHPAAPGVEEAPAARPASAVRAFPGAPSAGGRPYAPSPPLLPLWAAVVVAAVGGPVLDLAYPSVGVWPLAFVGIALALISLVGRSSWSALLVGFVFGAAFHFTHIEWITRYLGLVPWFALAGLETVFWAVGSVLIALAYRWMPRVGPRWWVSLTLLPLLVAGLWTAREIFMGSWPYTGFPWARMGMSQSESPLAHVASWVGVSGLTFLMVAFAAAAIEWGRSARALGIRAAVPTASLAAMLLLTPQWTTAEAGTMRVGSVQGNGPSGYFDQRAAGDVLRAQVSATAPLVDDDLDVLLWPEGGIDSDPLNNPQTARTLDGLSALVGAPLVVNAATMRGEEFFNTSMLWQAGERNPVQLHDKRMPVPFGEYVPDRWFFQALAPDLVGLIQREYTPGTNAPVFDVEGVGVGLAICFDVIYDEVIWEGARGGAEVYMLQTNNADFRNTDENLQQLAFARMRAIETGRSVVNISTVGTSQVIAPDGVTVDALPANEPGAMVTEVDLRTGLTPAVIIGGAVQSILSGASMLGLIVLGVSARRRSSQR